MSNFKPAARVQTKLRLALTGPPGSGKTLSALKFARGLVGPEGKIAVIDTEGGRACYYADKYKFETMQMDPPYLVKKYLDGIAEAAAAGFDCVILDSISHAWAGAGGILQRKEALDAKPNSNSYTNWAKMTPEQNAFVEAILQTKINLICTMRSKTEYVIVQNSKGKQAPQKVGLAPVQRDGIEYEFDIVMDIEQETHMATASKDTTGVFAKMEAIIIDESAGEAMAKWQASGAVPPPKPVKKEESVKTTPITEKKEESKTEVPKRPPNQTPEWLAVGEEIKAAMAEYRWTWDGVNQYVENTYKKKVAMLNLEELKQVLFHIINPPVPDNLPEFQSDSR